MSLQQMEHVCKKLGGDTSAFRGTCENILTSENAVAPRFKAPLGLELLRGATSDVAAVAAHVISSLREEHEDPPELFCDPVSKAMMEDPVVIETGYVFDRSSVFNASGKFRFENGCR